LLSRQLRPDLVEQRPVSFGAGRDSSQCAVDEPFDLRWGLAVTGQVEPFEGFAELGR